MTGRSPRRGTIISPRAKRSTASAAVAMADRIAVIHRGVTLCTRVLVIVQFKPQAITITANSRSALRRDKWGCMLIPLVRAFSSEVDPVRVKKTRQNKEPRAPFRFNRNGNGSSIVTADHNLDWHEQQVHF